MAFSGTQYTRLGLSSSPRQLYGSFAGKAAAGVETGRIAQVIMLGMNPILKVTAGSKNA